MQLYYGRTEENSDGTSERYLRINNCGGFEGLKRSAVKRPWGRLDYQLIFVKRGRLFIRKDEETLTLGENALWLYRPNEAQDYSVGEEETDYFWIHFAGSAVEEMLSFWESLPVYLENFTEVEMFCHSFYTDHKLSTRFNELYYEGALISLFGTLEKRLKAEENAELQRIRPALAHIEKCFPTRPDNGELARIACMSKHHFIKTFEKAMGTTPQKYITKAIMDKSKFLLKTTSLSVSEISLMLGVDDALYFSRMFKKNCGVSPKTYRESDMHKPTANNTLENKQNNT